MDGELTAKLKITVLVVTLTIMVTLMNCSGPDVSRHIDKEKVSILKTSD